MKIDWIIEILELIWNDKDNDRMKCDNLEVLIKFTDANNEKNKETINLEFCLFANNIFI